MCNYIVFNIWDHKQPIYVFDCEKEALVLLNKLFEIDKAWSLRKYILTDEV